MTITLDAWLGVDERKGDAGADQGEDGHGVDGFVGREAKRDGRDDRGGGRIGHEIRHDRRGESEDDHEGKRCGYA